MDFWPRGDICAICPARMFSNRFFNCDSMRFASTRVPLLASFRIWSMSFLKSRRVNAIALSFRGIAWKFLAVDVFHHFRELVEVVVQRIFELTHQFRQFAVGRIFFSKASRSASSASRKLRRASESFPSSTRRAVSQSNC